MTKKNSSRVSVIVCVLVCVASMNALALSPPNPDSDFQVYNPGATTLLTGCGVVLTGGVTGTAWNATRPAGADTAITAVMLSDAAAGSTGGALMRSYPSMYLRAGTTVAVGQRVNVMNTVGEWGPAASGSLNAYYESRETVSAGSLFWAIPIGSYSVAQSNYIQSSFGSASTDISLASSASFAAVTGCSTSLTTTGGKVKVTASFGLSNPTALGALNIMGLSMDGGAPAVGVGQSAPLLSSFGVSGALVRLYLSVTAGSHSFSVMGKTNAGSLQIRASSLPQQEHCAIVAEEVAA